MVLIRFAVIIGVVMLAAWLIRRAGADLRGELATKGGKGVSPLTPEQVQAITSRGLATPEQLFAMAPKEQLMLATTAMMLAAAPKKGGDSAAG